MPEEPPPDGPGGGRRAREATASYVDAVSVGLVLTGAALGATLVLLFLTLFPRWVHLPTWTPVPAMVAMGVLFAGSMGVGYRVDGRTSAGRQRTRSRGFLRPRPNPFVSFTRPQIVWHVALVILTGLVFATNARYAAQLPGYDAASHRYVLGGMVISEGTYFDAIANWERDLLVTAFFFLSLAAVIYFNERRWLARWWVRPRSPIHPRQWTWATAAIAATVLVGVAVIGSTGAVAVGKFNAYMASPTLPHVGSRTVTLGAGEQIIFQGCPHSGSCAHLLPSQVVVTSAPRGSPVPVAADPSNDDLGPDGIPSGGSVVFYAPRGGRYTIRTAAPRAGFLTVALGEGQELQSMLPWVLLPVVGLAVVAFAWVTTAVRRRRRRAPQTLDAPGAEGLPWPWNELPATTDSSGAPAVPGP